MHFLRPRVWSDCMHDTSFHSFDCWSFMDKLSVPLKKWEWNLTINFYYLSHRILKQTKHLYPKKEAQLSIFYKPANTMQGKVARKIPRQHFIKSNCNTPKILMWIVYSTSKLYSKRVDGKRGFTTTSSGVDLMFVNPMVAVISTGAFDGLRFQMHVWD